MLLKNDSSIREGMKDQTRDLSYTGLPVWEGKEGKEELGEPTELMPNRKQRVDTEDRQEAEGKLGSPA